MDSKGKNVSKPWKPYKIQKKPKIAKFYKILKPSKIFKIVKSLFKPFFTQTQPLREEFSRSVPRQPYNDEYLTYLQNPGVQFMTCIVKVNPSKHGWQRGVRKVLTNMKGIRFKMDQSGVVEVSGLGDPNILLKKLGKTRRVEVHWVQSGQCSNNLFMPETKKNPPQEKPNQPNYYNGPWNNRMPPPYLAHQHPYYQPPQVFRPGYGNGPYGYPYQQQRRVFNPYALY